MWCTGKATAACRLDATAKCCHMSDAPRRHPGGVGGGATYFARCCRRGPSSAGPDIAPVKTRRCPPRSQPPEALASRRLDADATRVPTSAYALRSEPSDPFQTFLTATSMGRGHGKGSRGPWKHGGRERIPHPVKLSRRVAGASLTWLLAPGDAGGRPSTPRACPLGSQQGDAVVHRRGTPPSRWECRHTGSNPRDVVEIRGRLAAARSPRVPDRQGLRL